MLPCWNVCVRIASWQEARRAFAPDWRRENDPHASVGDEHRISPGTILNIPLSLLEVVLVIQIEWSDSSPHLKPSLANVFWRLTDKMG